MGEAVDTQAVKPTFKDDKLKVAALLDTNVWIRLGAAPAYLPKLKQLIALRDAKKLHLIVPEILVIEYARHRDKIANGWKKNISDMCDLSDLIRIIPGKEKDFNDIQSRLTNLTKEAIDAHPESLSIIDGVLSEKTCLEITDDKLVLAARRSIEKKAPSHNKDSTADALLWLGATAHLDTSNVFFCTNNSKDFSDPKDAATLHPDLAADADGKAGSICYLKNVDTIIEHFEALSDKTKFEIPWKPYEDHVAKPGLCPRCDGEDTFTDGAYLNSRYGGLTLQYMCRQCGYRYDTGDFFD